MEQERCGLFAVALSLAPSPQSPADEFDQFDVAGSEPSTSSYAATTNIPAHSHSGLSFVLLPQLLMTCSMLSDTCVCCIGVSRWMLCSLTIDFVHLVLCICM